MSKANVLLVNPRYNGRSEIPPLGLEYLAAPLLEEGVGVSILDLDISSTEEGEKSLSCILQEFEPQLLGITAMSHSFSSALDVCSTAKAFDRNILTVMGGIHATVRSDKILREHSDVDVCVRGEGELTFSELVHNFVSRRPIADIEGLSYREGSSVVHNKGRALVKDLDELSNPAHHLVRGERYRTRSISSSRGCHHNCTFCSIRSQYGKTVRTRSAESIVGEIRMLVDGGAGSIMFTDDNFTGNAARIRKICNWIERTGLAGRVEFYAEGRIDDICRNPITASILSHAGFKGLYIGAESGSPIILDYYNKGMCPDDIIRGVGQCIEQNLMPVVNFILFGPRDTIATVKETIRLARQIFEMGAEIVYGEALIPYPGTPIEKSLAGDGMFDEQGCVYYFKSYHGLELEWFLRLCNIARAVTDLFHREDKYFSARKAYFELGYLDELLSGRIPARFGEAYNRSSSGADTDLPPRIKEIREYITATLGTTASQR